MRGQAQGRWPGPGALQYNVLKAVFDKLADPRRTIDVGDDFKQEVRRFERRFDLRQVGFTVLVSHRPGRDPKRTVIQRADERVDLSPQGRLRELLGKAPELAPAGDRPLVVEEHAMSIAARAGRGRTPGSPGRFRCSRRSHLNPACG